MYRSITFRGVTSNKETIKPVLEIPVESGKELSGKRNFLLADLLCDTQVEQRKLLYFPANLIGISKNEKMKWKVEIFPGLKLPDTKHLLRNN